MPEPISEDEALRRLREFLRQLEKLLADLATNPGSLIPGRHHEAMRVAWLAVRPKFEILIKDLTLPQASVHLPQLENLGLMGDQLVFKLSIFDHAHGELLDRTAETARSDTKPERSGWSLGRIWRKLFGHTLKAADVILDSLGDVPFFPAHSIKEFKKAGECGLKLGETIAEDVGASLDPTMRHDSEP